ncbi:hypothetical protein D4764_01G0016390 [Takifugu flavidus]|uniref:PiggyBac transposable element-derived protein domain-containing protein n=1 Tax=Takifugu flavidus TaxID=433684 RepID=A0A5C6PQ95_9TELE|nr:hypothetical protein D4764_01G0016390 [Takifugu flavidus]
MRRRHLSIRARTTVAQRLPVDYQERVAIFRTYCRDKITAPSHITNMDEILLTFDIPLTHKMEKKGPARTLDDGKRTLLHKDYEAAAGKLCYHMQVDCRRMGYDTVFMCCKSFHKINAEPEPVETHPSILYRLSGVGSRGQQPKERSPDFPLPGYLLQLIRRDPQAFPGHVERHSLSNVSWVSPGVSYRRDMP